MPLGMLAPHVAQLADFGLTVLTEPGLDFSQQNFAPLPFESAAQLVRAFDESAAKVRRALQQVSDGAWSEPWKLSFQSKTIFEGSRFLAYRQMFLNHIIHHRAQLGVYLRLNSEPVPATYGPSADDRLGFNAGPSERMGCSRRSPIPNRPSDPPSLLYTRTSPGQRLHGRL
jgi:uncharacterized damage-inducible protein DinB